MSRVLRFLLVGGVGFLVDAGVLLVLITAGLGPLPARLAAILVALTVTWLLNRSLTFGPSTRSLAAEGGRYGGVGLATSAVSFAVYSALLLLMPWLPPILALAVGSAAAMALSYLGYSRLVFGR
ncbi:GtrA family protein [Rhizobium sp. YIM 134829]|uniref:GtrA family protein n=1 Tax=Rhizobium sp. YIM 134829 TaxID=3390453 RepID=UPI003978109C